jgi:hypothetical protein
VQVATTMHLRAVLGRKRACMVAAGHAALSVRKKWAMDSAML